jgi:hypothetical protein
MSEEEKREIRHQLRDRYRAVKDDLTHRQAQIGIWAEGFAAMAEALRSDTPERMVFVGPSPDAYRPGDHPVPVDDYPEKARLLFSVAKAAEARLGLAELERQLRSVGDWPVD